MRTGSIISVIMIACFCVMICSCKPQSDIAGNYTFETECVGAELDGSQTLKVWGSGRYKEDAIEQAKKNGIRDVLFKGIRNGTPDCNVKPLIPEVNAQEKYEDYFNKFFADGGAYQNYVKLRDGKVLDTREIKYKGSTESKETYAIIIIVLRSELKAKMIADNILKP